MEKQADTLILGNIITMDENKPRARAVAAAQGKIVYVGGEETARSLCADDAVVLDYGDNYVYPGFLEAHCHPGGAGARAIGQANLLPGKSIDEYVQITADYIAANPGRELYTGANWMERDRMPDARDLDAICPDVPVVLQTGDGHSMWLNTAALERFGIDRACAEKWGPAVVRLREDGTPTGYISEGPVFDIMKAIAYTREQMKGFLLWFQDFMLSMGFTGAYDAGYEVFNAEELQAFAELDAEGKLKMQITGGMMTEDNSDTPEDDAERIAQAAAKLNSDHLRIIGAKGFSDGVVEAHTGWLKEEYADQAGYTGVKRWSDHGKMVRLLKALDAHGLNIHVHTIGDGASGFMIDAIEEAQAATGNYDMRNALAHLHVVDPADRARIADNNIVACVGLMWSGASGIAYEQEIKYLGSERVKNTYPGQSIIDLGGMVVNHSDYPVALAVGVPLGVYMSVLRGMPTFPADTRRNVEVEGMSRMDALRGMTTNVAYMWHAEDRMGSLSIGKLANMAVFDKDFLADDIEDIAWARCLATIVDGEQVYEIGSDGPVGPTMDEMLAAEG